MDSFTQCFEMKGTGVLNWEESNYKTQEIVRLFPAQMIGDLGIQKPGAFLELFLSKIHMGGALPWDDGIEQA